MNIKSKLPNVGTTIFSTMSKMAADNDALNLSQGFPDFDCNNRLKKLVQFYIKNGYNQYAPMPGLMEFRTAIGKKIERLYGRYYSPETEITITAGATQAIYTALGAIVRPNDEVIVFTPAYDCYDPAIRLYGGITKEIPLKLPDYKIDFELLKKTINAKTKAIVINSPHNPTGSVISNKELKQLEKILRPTDILLISDEVYEHIVFDGTAHASVAMFSSLSKRSFVISSMGKTYHNTGWKIGYCYAPKFLTDEFRKVHQFNVFSVNRPYQHAFADLMNEERSYLELSSFYEKKRDYFLKKIKGSKFKALPCKGTYFQLLDYSSLSQLNDMKMAEKLCKEAGIAAIPLSPFYLKDPQTKVLRFCFAKDKSTLKEGAEILCSL